VRKNENPEEIREDGLRNAKLDRRWMEGYCFSDGDVGRLRKVLREQGIL
jgi:hypothetical protein